MSARFFAANPEFATALAAPTCYGRLHGRTLRPVLAVKRMRVESNKDIRSKSSPERTGIQRRLHHYVNGGTPNFFYIGTFCLLAWWYITIQLDAIFRPP
ncbi:hypothetical protein WJX73_001335 [Symbiochloris irregularis]|uniref:Uncharacterized protein n=1 Tax=Symbiochloris irregularis TaxID=706552 RepID=A0AAW1NNS2_9CHLO